MRRSREGEEGRKEAVKGERRTKERCRKGGRKGGKKGGRRYLSIETARAEAPGHEQPVKVALKEGGKEGGGGRVEEDGFQPLAGGDGGVLEGLGGRGRGREGERGGVG